MSKTLRGSKGPGFDFGSRYKCDRHYSGGSGNVPKRLAASERRNTGKDLVRKDLSLIPAKSISSWLVSKNEVLL